jgi:hypothetical protein
VDTVFCGFDIGVRGLSTGLRSEGPQTREVDWQGGRCLLLPEVFIDASCGGACARVFERAADPLHRTRIDAEPSGNLAHAFCALRLVQPHGCGFQLRGYQMCAQSIFG